MAAEPNSGLGRRISELMGKLMGKNLDKKKALKNQGLVSDIGGDGGIRTHDTGFARMLP
jgi:hypothetical protein